MNNLALGTAGEYRVMSELLLRGHVVFTPAVDNGVDLVLGNGKRIQVKSTDSEVEYRKGVKFYAFTIHKNIRHGHVNKKYKSDLAKEFDFLIACVPRENIFYIIPSEVLGKVSTVAVPTERDNKSKYSEYKDNWGLLERR